MHHLPQRFLQLFPAEHLTDSSPPRDPTLDNVSATYCFIPAGTVLSESLLENLACYFWAKRYDKTILYFSYEESNADMQVEEVHE